jgi:hypothetical protein
MDGTGTAAGTAAGMAAEKGHDHRITTEMSSLPLEDASQADGFTFHQGQPITRKPVHP